MTSWVRYSIAVYVGLLLAGALVVPRPEAEANGGSAQMRQDAELRHEHRQLRQPFGHGTEFGRQPPMRMASVELEPEPAPDDSLPVADSRD